MAKYSKISDRVMRYLFRSCSLVALVTITAMFLFLIKESFPAFEELTLGDFFLSATWNPDGWDGEYYGILSLLWGSIYVTLVTMLISIPIGLLCSVYLAEYAPPKVQIFMKPAVELLAGIPSVVIGFFGIVFVGPMIARIFNIPNGLSVLNGGILLSIMVLPTIISLSEDAIVAIPDHFRHASLSMGATKLETVLFVVIPAARSGIIASIMLGMGRAIGETMAVLMACGNTPALAVSIFDSVRTLTSTIAIEMGEVAYDTTHYYALFNLGLYLFIISFAINTVADTYIRKRIKAT